LRFFERAINVYDEGFTKFPKSFDLAYNKARVQYEVATHPKLAKQLQQPLLDLLRAALASHEVALKLDENDADLLFNTSQVLTSIAEELANGGLTEEAITLLQSAVQLQARCLSVQEQKYVETLEQEKEAREFFESRLNNDDGAEAMQDDGTSNTNSTKPSEEGKWASVLEPVTIDTLIDTITACFGTMTTLCTTISISRYTSWEVPLADIESQSAQLMEKVQGLSSQSPENLHELALADAILRSALLDASFTLNSAFPAATYRSMLIDLWNAKRPHLSMDTSVEDLIAHANALVAFNFSLLIKQDDPNTGLLGDYRWAALTSAIGSLTIASKVASISQDDKAKTHLLRGDISLLQYRLSSGFVTHKQAIANAPTLLKNAEVFYRNAAHMSSEQEDKFRALVRCNVAEHLDRQDVEGAGGWSSVFGINQERARPEMQEMIDEGLVTESTGPN
jgi:tetratricopeptide (TPR) repeat protein